MFILRRKVGQSIIIDDDTILTVVKRVGNSVILHINRTLLHLDGDFTFDVNEDLAVHVEGANVKITYLGHKKGSEHIGFDAPKHIKIIREELYKLEGVKHE